MKEYEEIYLYNYVIFASEIEVSKYIYLRTLCFLYGFSTIHL